MELDNRKVSKHKKQIHFLEDRGSGCSSLLIKLSRAQGVAGIVVKEFVPWWYLPIY